MPSATRWLSETFGPSPMNSSRRHLCVMRLLSGASPRMRFDILTNLAGPSMATKGDSDESEGTAWRPIVPPGWICERSWRLDAPLAAVITSSSLLETPPTILECEGLPRSWQLLPGCQWCWRCRSDTRIECRCHDSDASAGFSCAGMLRWRRQLTTFSAHRHEPPSLPSRTFTRLKQLDYLIGDRPRCQFFLAN